MKLIKEKRLLKMLNTKNNFKECSCSDDSWEVIIVDDDENFGGKSAIYHHCGECGEDFAIQEFYTQELLYLKPLNKG